MRRPSAPGRQRTSGLLVSRIKGPCRGGCQLLQDVAEYAAFAALDRAQTMTAAIANLTAGSIVD